MYANTRRNTCRAVLLCIDSGWIHPSHELFYFFHLSLSHKMRDTTHTDVQDEPQRPVISSGGRCSIVIRIRIIQRIKRGGCEQQVENSMDGSEMVPPDRFPERLQSGVSWKYPSINQKPGYRLRDCQPTERKHAWRGNTPGGDVRNCQPGWDAQQPKKELLL